MKEYNNKLNIISSKRFSANSSINDVNNWLEESNNKSSDLKVEINNKDYNITLEDNETVKSFLKLLPQEFNMEELNGNEKYIYLDTKLPTNPSNPKHINAGDIMLYNDNCLVIFYKSFDTTYSYTKIGHIDNLEDLGSNSIKVSFKFE